jgi:hypothetical protein
VLSQTHLMDAKCILNEFYQRYRIAGLNYEFEETTDAGFTCTLALPPIPGGSSSNQDQKCLQEPLSFLGTGSSKKVRTVGKCLHE